MNNHSKMKINQTITVTTELESFELAKDLCVVRINQTCDMPYAGLPLQNREGLCKSKELLDFQSGGSTFIEFADLCVYADSTLEDMKNNTGWSFYDAIDGVFDRFASGELTIANVVRFDSPSNLAFSHDGRILPTPIKFFSCAGITNNLYDLPKALKILQSIDGVHAMAPSSRRGNGTQPSKLCITEIPYYNQDDETKSEILFSYVPTADIMALVWMKAKTLNRQYPSAYLREALLELDILGLVAGGAKLT